MKIWRPGDECYFFESNVHIKQSVVKSVKGVFCILQYGMEKVIRVHQTRLYKSELKAMSIVLKPKKSWHNPHDYEH